MSSTRRMLCFGYGIEVEISEWRGNCVGDRVVRYLGI